MAVVIEIKPGLGACFFCKRHAYQGCRLDDWDIMVCDHCRRIDHYGIVPANHPSLVAHFKARRIEPRKNALGLICWPEINTAAFIPVRRSSVDQTFGIGLLGAIHHRKRTPMVLPLRQRTAH